MNFFEIGNMNPCDVVNNTWRNMFRYASHYQAVYEDRVPSV